MVTNEYYVFYFTHVCSHKGISNISQHRKQNDSFTNNEVSFVENSLLHKAMNNWEGFIGTDGQYQGSEK